MEKIEVIRWKMYDMQSDDWVLSKRWATPEAVARMGGSPIPNSSEFVPPTMLVYPNFNPCMSEKDAPLCF